MADVPSFDRWVALYSDELVPHPDRHKPGFVGRAQVRLGDLTTAQQRASYEEFKRLAETGEFVERDERGVVRAVQRLGRDELTEFQRQVRHEARADEREQRARSTQFEPRFGFGFRRTDVRTARIDELLARVPDAQRPLIEELVRRGDLPEDVLEAIVAQLETLTEHDPFFGELTGSSEVNPGLFGRRGPRDGPRFNPTPISATDAMALLYRMNPAELRETQRKLYDAGFYGPGVKWEDLDPGTLGDNGLTRRAWQDLMAETQRRTAAGLHATLSSTLASLQGNRQRRFGDESDEPGRKIVLSAPEDLVPVVKRAAVQVIGRKLTDGEAQQFVQFIHSKEQAAQGSEEGTVTSAPQSGLAVEEWLRSRYGAEAQRMDVISALDRFEQAVSGAPS